MSRSGIGSAAGAMVGAVLASACCLGPFVFGLLGLGGVGAAGQLEAWRPFVMAGTLALLAAGFYFTYRRRSAADECACERARRGRTVLWIATVIVGASLVYPYASRVIAAKGSLAVSGAAVAAVQIKGMSCASCTVGVQTALFKLPGVKAVSVSYEEKLAQIAFDPSKVTQQQIVQAVAELGYEATLVGS